MPPPPREKLIDCEDFPAYVRFEEYETDILRIVNGKGILYGQREAAETPRESTVVENYRDPQGI